MNVILFEILSSVSTAVPGTDWFKLRRFLRKKSATSQFGVLIYQFMDTCKFFVCWFEIFFLLIDKLLSGLIDWFWFWLTIIPKTLSWAHSSIEVVCSWIWWIWWIGDLVDDDWLNRLDLWTAGLLNKIAFTQNNLTKTFFYRWKFSYLQKSKSQKIFIFFPKKRATCLGKTFFTRLVYLNKENTFFLKLRKFIQCVLKWNEMNIYWISSVTIVLLWWDEHRETYMLSLRSLLF